MFDKTVSIKERCDSTIVRSDIGGRYTEPISKLFVFKDNKAKTYSTFEALKGTRCDLSENFMAMRTLP